MARATRPNDSKKFLVWRSPGRARLSTPKHPCSRHHVDQRVHHHLADAELPRARVGVEVGDDAEAAAVGEHLDAGDAVAHHDVVDGADQHVVRRVGELGAELRLERRPAGRLAGPHLAPAPSPQLVDGGLGQLGEPGQVVLGGRPAALLRGRRHQRPWSCATFDRIVLRPRWAASYSCTFSSSTGERPGEAVHDL